MVTHVQQLLNLAGRNALITGGSRGLGLQIAEGLGEAGANVMLTSRKAADLEEATFSTKPRANCAPGELPRTGLPPMPGTPAMLAR
jgi:NAD(P)-dependent dehydrogenase (short-subunit alcohol dehydrogenase family)